MEKEKVIQLLEYLQLKRDWVSSNELAHYFGVSSRQIRSYISAANGGAAGPLVTSSGKGYRLLQKRIPARVTAGQNGIKTVLPQQRQQYISAMILHSPNGIDIFSLSEDLFVSIPTLENDLGKIRRESAIYDLSLKKKGDIITLSGQETDKRRMIKDLLFDHRWDAEKLADSLYFSSNPGNSPAEGSVFHKTMAHIPGFMKHVRMLLNSHSIYYNDYMLNDLVLQILIMADRIRQNCLIKELPSHPVPPVSHVLSVTEDFADYLETVFSIRLNTDELHYLETILSDNVSILNPSQITEANLEQFIELKYIEATRMIIEQVKENYLVDSFDEDFFIKFTIHLKNLFIRTNKKITAKNPLKDKVKYSYPLIHDISVFIAGILEQEYGLAIDEDEIAYIAFHLCTCLYGVNQQQVTATFVYANYYDYYQKTVDLLSKTFEDTLVIKFVVPIHEYIPTACHSDLIISTINSRLPKPCIFINPFPVKQDLEQIRRQIEEIQRLKNYALFQQHFLHFFSPQCFFFNTCHQDSQSLIRIMCDHVSQIGFAQTQFTEDVLRREQMSDTAFHEVAVPHAMSQNVNRSFISVAVNKPPVFWNQESSGVKIVMLIGIHKDDRRIFSRIFDFLVEILSNTDNVALLESADSFVRFTELICEMAGDVCWE